MKTILLFLLLPLTLLAQLKIAVSYPYIGALVDTIGAEHAKSISLAQGKWDPHFIIPKPSLIAKVRNSDAIIINGAQLEIGWLPPLIDRAGNTKTMPNASTFLNLSHFVEFLDKPTSVDRKDGDIHPDGNPHFHLSPYNILPLAKAIKEFLIKIDMKNRDAYEKNHADFVSMWQENLLKWQKIMADKKGLKVIQYHDNLAYFNRAYGLETIATLEPLAGIPPSSKHTLHVIDIIKENNPCCILHDVYHSTKTADYISQKSSIKVVLMPHDIGAIEETTDLVALFDYLVNAIK